MAITAKRQRQLNVVDVLKRSCTCKKQHCFTQFAGVAGQVDAVREKFKNLEANDKIAYLESEYNFGHGFSTGSNTVSTASHKSGEHDPDVLLDSDDDTGPGLRLDPDDESAVESELLRDSDDEILRDNEAEEIMRDSDDEILYASDEEPPQTQTKGSYAARRSTPYSFLDKPVCRKAFNRLLGVGTGT